VLIAACSGAPVLLELPPSRPFDVARATVHRGAQAAARSSNLSRQEALLRMDRALGAARSGEWTDALVDFEVVERALPNYYSYRPAYAEALWFGANDIAGAATQLDRCLELAPGNLECRRIRSLIRTERGDYDGALEDAEAVATLRPDDGDIQERFARLLLRVNRVDEALDVLEALTRIAPRQVSAHLLRARTLEARGEVDRARDAYEWVREIHRDPVQGTTYLLRFLERQGLSRDATRVRRELDRYVRERQLPDRRMRPL
jgi:tetratricopeptide (TPR) repeat protein